MLSRSSAPRVLAGLLLLSFPATAQRGDRKGEVQPPLPASLKVPAAPARTPAEELATFVLAPGLRVELVAAEPLVQDPVAMAFDGDGRLWVAEMRALMPNVDGTGEAEPIGSIAVLTDTDGDGRMDERKVFLDNLVLPRAIAPCRRGALLITPPQLLFCEDTDGDGVADTREVIDIGLGGLGSPEHAINGLIYTLDNGFRCANEGVTYRFVDGAWIETRHAGGGQWGLTRDDLGRFFFNTNSDPLRGDRYPSHYSIRNPSFGRASGVNVRVASSRTTWPGRINPGVNRGYQPATLRDDYTLRRFTGACGPSIYRGDMLPAQFKGQAFVPEPCGNLVKLYRLVPDNKGGFGTQEFWEGREFMTSTDERFRPVNSYTGPDGALYILDLYRGILQHRVFLTTFLRNQIIERGLDKHIHMGRIWRIVPEEFERPALPRMSEASWSELAGYLSHPNGWWRDTAQRIIVEEGLGERDAEEVLLEELEKSASGLGRMHCLWALQGIGAIEPDLLMRALQDEDLNALHAAVRVSEEWLTTGHVGLTDRLVELAHKGDLGLRRQVILSLGEAHTARADAALLDLAAEDVKSGEARGWFLSGLHQREFATLERLLGEQRWQAAGPGRAGFIKDLARCVAIERSSPPIESLMQYAVAMPTDRFWQGRAILDGLLAARGKGPKGGPGRIHLTREPAPLVALLASSDEATAKKSEELSASLLWPGRPGIDPADEVRPLTAEESARFDRGRELFNGICAQCHQTSGRGEPGKAPPLRGTKYVLGRPDRLAAILLNGLNGPLKIERTTWNMEMPAFVESDEGIAAVATYIRREWGHGADPLTAAEVAAVRAVISTRSGPWTEADLVQHYGAK